MVKTWNRIWTGCMALSAMGWMTGSVGCTRPTTQSSKASQSKTSQTESAKKRAPERDGMMGELSQRVRHSGYRVSAGQNGLHAKNPAHGLSVDFGAGAVGVKPASPSQQAEDSWSLRVRLSQWGRAGKLTALKSSSPRLGACLATGEVDVGGQCLRRVEYPHAGLIEWWENRPSGLEQGWTVDKAPSGDGPMMLSVEFRGLLPKVKARALHASLSGPAKQRMSYGNLKAWDASGRKLPVWMEKSAPGLSLFVDDANARYPITIDPILTSDGSRFELVSDLGSAQLGYSVASVGDVNGDGFGDVAIGAPLYDAKGRVFVYLGTRTWPEGLGDPWIIDGDQQDAWFGHSVASAGDVNGDGFGDVVVGAPFFSNGHVREGRASVYLGSAQGFQPAPWVVESNQTGAEYGHSVSSAGDVNGDGYGDVLIGAPKFENNGDSGLADEGRAYLYLGGAGGLATTPIWEGRGDRRKGAKFGFSVGAAGDVDGDGFGDVVVGAPDDAKGAANSGAVFVYFGAETGIAPNRIWTTNSNAGGAQLGFSVGGAGDVNGDGYADVVVGVPGESYTISVGRVSYARTGVVHIYFGSGEAEALPTGGPSVTIRADLELRGAANGRFGQSVGSAGDVNGDGRADVVVGAPLVARSYVFFDLGISQENQTRPHIVFERADGGEHGFSAASAGDVNGDGFADIVVGTPKHAPPNLADAGLAEVYLGGGGDVLGLFRWQPTRPSGGGTRTRFGFATAAGDVNADGFSDLIVGAPNFDAEGVSPVIDKGKVFVYLGPLPSDDPEIWELEALGTQASALFGHAVAAGDLNHDGFDDIIVGEPGFNEGPQFEKAGRVHVILGAPERNQLVRVRELTAFDLNAGAQFGFAVDTAGDVNGDGIGDLVVGAPFDDEFVDDNRGTVEVYLGRTDLGANQSLDFEGSVGGAENGENFGFDVASVGDVNGDGFGDIVVGAPGSSQRVANGGRAVIYTGSPQGIRTAFFWRVDFGVANARYGESVAPAGDVNGDGLDDVLIGNKQSIGVPLLYLGGQPMSQAAALSVTGGHASVASVGDANGDGFGDFVVGGTVGTVVRYGKAFAPGEEGLALRLTRFGRTDWAPDVGFAGDVNGDGYGDFVTANPAVEAVRLYTGNSDSGFLVSGRLLAGNPTPPAFPLNPEARRVDEDVRVAPWSRSSSTVFRILANGIASIGRSRVRLQAEVKPLGELFDGTGLVTARDWVDNGDPEDAARPRLRLAVSVPTPDAAFHWRARILYDSAHGSPMRWSPWFYGGISGQANGVHIRVGGRECGNGDILEGVEECDDGDFDDGDGCSGTCLIERGYQCEGEPSVCTTECGDGVRVPEFEECDDRNLQPNDGCDELCKVEQGFLCSETGDLSTCRVDPNAGDPGSSSDGGTGSDGGDGGTGGTDGGTSGGSSSPDDDGGGCGCRSSNPSGISLFFLSLLVPLFVLRRKRRAL